MNDNRTGIQPQVRDELDRITIKSIELIKDSANVITGGTVTFNNDETVPIVVKEAV